MNLAAGNCFIPKPILEGFEEQAQSGQVVEVSDIEAAYEEAVGHSIGGGQIYRVLKRHGRRKIKPLF